VCLCARVRVYVRVCVRVEKKLRVDVYERMLPYDIFSAIYVCVHVCMSVCLCVLVWSCLRACVCQIMYVYLADEACLFMISKVFTHITCVTYDVCIIQT